MKVLVRVFAVALAGGLGCSSSKGDTGVMGAQGAQGPVGPQGAVGPQGPQGVQGSSGVIATGYASFRYDTDNGFMPVSLPSDDSLGQVMDLTSGSRHSGLVSVAAPARLVVSMSAYLSNQDTDPRGLSCQIMLEPDGGAAQPVSFQTNDTFQEYESKTITVTGAIDVDGGSYNASLQCLTGLANPNGAFWFGDLTVVGYAR